MVGETPFKVKLLIYHKVVSFNACIIRKSTFSQKVIVNKQLISPSYTVQFLVGFEIKPERTVLKLSGIHRLSISFRAIVITHNFQTFFLPQGKNSEIIHQYSFHLFKVMFHLGLHYSKILELFCKYF